MEEKKKTERVQTETPKRSLMLWVLAGFYLLYTGYKLCKNVIDGVEGGGIGFMFAGIVFIAIGGALLFFGVRGLVNMDKIRKEQEAAEAEEQIEETVVEENVSAEPEKAMSISERAGLVKSLEEEEAQDEEEEKI